MSYDEDIVPGQVSCPSHTKYGWSLAPWEGLLDLHHSAYLFLSSFLLMVEPLGTDPCKADAFMADTYMSDPPVVDVWG